MGHPGGEPRHGFEFLRLTQLVLALPQSGFGRFPGRARLRFAQLALDRWTQPGEFALHDEIVRPGLHGRDGGLLAHDRRHQDKRQVLTALLQHFQRLEPPKAGHLIIRNDKVPGLFLKRCLHLRPGPDPLVKRLIAGLSQGVQDDYCIIFRVVGEQDPQGAGRGAR